jgi:hypothetical protein
MASIETQISDVQEVSKPDLWKPLAFASLAINVILAFLLVCGVVAFVRVPARKANFEGFEYQEVVYGTRKYTVRTSLKTGEQEIFAGETQGWMPLHKPDIFDKVTPAAPTTDDYHGHN